MLNRLILFSGEDGFKICIKFIVFSFCLSTSAINAQILQDTASLNLIKRGVDSLYNLQFSYASEVYNTINQRYPDNPVVAVFKGIMTYWKTIHFFPAHLTVSHLKQMHR